MQTGMQLTTAKISQNDFIDIVFEKQRKNLQFLKNKTAKERIAAIQKVKTYLKDKQHEEALCEAMFKDFKKPKAEVLATEIIPTISHVSEISKNLKSWVLSRSHSVPLAFIGLGAKSMYEPKGQALVIAPWNYPFLLSVYPVLYAIAAGCSVILKPSELTAHTSKFLETMLHELYPENEVKVFLGEVPTTTHLLSKKWGHVFFTGSPNVGKIVMKAASQTLSSVSLELGGKSPCIIDESAELEGSIDKLLWGKFVNAGQTCIAPDYVLVHKSHKKIFSETIKYKLANIYGNNPEESDSLARIISIKHAQRLSDLLDDALSKGAKIVSGGQKNIDSKYICPTVIYDVNNEMKIMQEEIFGPLLPIIFYERKEEVIELINSLDKPLSMYICSRENKNIEYFIDNTTSGGTLINEFLLGAAIPSVPFGGVNNSGIGKAFGFHGFVEFSNERPIIRRNFMTIKFIYPPYTDRVVKIINLLKRIV